MREAIEILTDRLVAATKEAATARADAAAARAEALRLSAQDSQIKVQDVNSLLNFMAQGRKIEAIKQHRMITGYGLKESKEAIEAAWAGRGILT